MYKLKAILATTADHVIGKNDGLPWKKQKSDMKHFKAYTSGQVCIVGRKTFESIGELPGREFYVVTREPNKYKNTEKVTYGKLENIPIKGVVIGGAEIYRSLLPLCEEVSVTTFNVEGLDGNVTFNPTMYTNEMNLEEVHFIKANESEYEAEVKIYRR